MSLALLLIPVIYRKKYLGQLTVNGFGMKYVGKEHKLNSLLTIKTLI